MTFHFLPFGGLAAGLTKDPGADVDDEIGFLRDVDEASRGDEVAVVIPPDERLGSGECPRFQRLHWLIVDNQLVAGDGVAKRCLDRKPVQIFR